MAITYSKRRINWVRLLIPLVVSSTGKNNISLSPFASENLVLRDAFGSPVPRIPDIKYLKYLRTFPKYPGLVCQDLTLLIIIIISIKLYSYYCRYFVCISFTADGPQRTRLPILPVATLPSCLWSLRIFSSFPGSRLRFFYRDASPALLQLVNPRSKCTYTGNLSCRESISLIRTSDTARLTSTRS